MDLLDKLKLLRDELNLMIDAEEKKRPYPSEVGKRFSDRIKGMERKDDDKYIAGIVKIPLLTFKGDDLKLTINRKRGNGDTQIEKIF